MDICSAGTTKVNEEANGVCRGLEEVSAVGAECTVGAISLSEDTRGGAPSRAPHHQVRVLAQSLRTHSFLSYRVHTLLGVTREALLFLKLYVSIPACTTACGSNDNVDHCRLMTFAKA